jgi:hypothetical protein
MKLATDIVVLGHLRIKNIGKLVKVARDMTRAKLMVFS